MKHPYLLFPRLTLCALLLCQFPLSLHAATPAPSVIDNVSFSGQADPEQASFILKGRLKGASTEDQEPKLIYSLHSSTMIQVDPTNITQICELKARIFQGKMKELVLTLRGDGDVTQVTGPDLKDWSVRFGAQAKRFLVIRPQEAATNAAFTNFAVTVSTKQYYETPSLAFSPLSFTPENAVFFDGSIELKTLNTLELSVTNLAGLSPIQSEVTDSTAAKSQPLRFRFSGSEYALGLEIREKDPDARKVAWENFKLI